MIFLRCGCLWPVLFGSFLVFAQGENAKSPSHPKVLAYQAELSAISTLGNSQAFTFGLSNKLSYSWNGYEMQARLGAINVETTRKIFTAEGTPEDYEVVETEELTRTEEKLYLGGGFLKAYRPLLHGYATLDWDRNEPAGVQDRLSASLGLASPWHNEEAFKFRTGYGLQYTSENQVVEPSGYDRSSLGLRLEVNLLKGFAEKSKFTLDAVGVGNLEESSDWRADVKSALTSTLWKKVALKVGLNLGYDHQPAFRSVPLVEDGVSRGTVLVPLEELDLLLTSTLVINF
jgi:hypothetical protein